MNKWDVIVNRDLCIVLRDEVCCWYYIIPSVWCLLWLWSLILVFKVWWMISSASYKPDLFPPMGAFLPSSLQLLLTLLWKTRVSMTTCLCLSEILSKWSIFSLATNQRPGTRAEANEWARLRGPLSGLMFRQESLLWRLSWDQTIGDLYSSFETLCVNMREKSISREISNQNYSSFAGLQNYHYYLEIVLTFEKVFFLTSNEFLRWCIAGGLSF